MTKTLFYSHFYCWQKYKRQERGKATKEDEKERRKSYTHLTCVFPLLFSRHKLALMLTLFI